MDVRAASSIELEYDEFKAVLHTLTIVEVACGANPNQKFQLSGLWTPEAAIEEVSRCFGVVPKRVSRVHHDTYVEGAFADVKGDELATLLDRLKGAEAF